MYSVFKKPLFLLLCAIIITIIGVVIISSKNTTKKSAVPAISSTPISKSAFSTNAKPGSCLILEEKYCSKFSLVDDPYFKGEKAIAYKLPKNTPIFAPVDGGFSSPFTFAIKDSSTEKNERYPGVTITILKTGTKTIDKIYGFVFFGETEKQAPKNVIKGNLIGKISEKSISKIGDYNLIIFITKSTTPNVFKNDIDSLLKLF